MLAVTLSWLCKVRRGMIIIAAIRKVLWRLQRVFTFSFDPCNNLMRQVRQVFLSLVRGCDLLEVCLMAHKWQSWDTNSGDLSSVALECAQI